MLLWLLRDGRASTRILPCPTTAAQTVDHDLPKARATAIPLISTRQTRESARRFARTVTPLGRNEIAVRFEQTCGAIRIRETSNPFVPNSPNRPVIRRNVTRMTPRSSTTALTRRAANPMIVSVNSTSNFTLAGFSTKPAIVESCRVACLLGTTSGVDG
jgi:hypothetical protein